MSIHPNRVLARIIEQVEQSDWPPLVSMLCIRAENDECIRIYSEPMQARYATPFHFWVHALRDELASRGRTEDLMSVAGHALCQKQPFSEWSREIGPGVWIEDAEKSASAEIFRMQANACRRSSVARTDARLTAHFWGHGLRATWHRRTI